VCWPHSSPGNVSVPCPSYLPWWNEGNKFVFTNFQQFLLGGQWRDT
jgi:glucagon-like peptide 2 receptor